MNSKRLYFVLLGVIGLLIIALVGSAYVVDKLLTGQSQKLVENRKEVAVLAAEQHELTRAKQDIAKYQDLADIAKSVVPQDKDQAQTVRQLVSIAGANDISISSITFPSSTLGSSATRGVSTKPGLSQLLPVKGVSGVFNLQITVQSDSTRPVPFGRFIAFLNALEHNRRTAQVSSISIEPDQKDRSTLSFNLVLEEYIKP